MKTLLLSAALLIAASVPSLAQGLKTATPPAAAAFTREKFDPLRDPKADIEAAVVKAKAQGKRIVLDLGGEWCGWCRYMDRFFFENADLARLRDDNFVWVKVNFSEENENPAFLAAYPAAAGYPHLYILDETGKLLHSQDTSALEQGKGYNLAKFTEFLRAWSPKKESAR